MIRTNITGIGDPFILLYGDTYYMYATSAKDGFKCFTAKNLDDEWKDEGYCYKDSTWAENCFWAPEVYFYNNKFYMLYTARQKSNHSLRTALAVSNSPLGPFKDIKDGPLFDYGFATIDATFFFDDDKNYLYFVRDCSEYIVDGVHTSAIYGVEIDKTLTKILTEPVLISYPDNPWERTIDPKWCWNEGPALLKHNNKYYLNFSVNCYDNRNYCVGCSESSNPLGPFKKYEKPILVYKENDFSGPGHNNFFRSKEGKLLTSFHIHTFYDNPSGNRRACIGEVCFDDLDRMKIII